MNRSPSCTFVLIPFVLTCFALSPHAGAVCQEGCDTSNGNTFLGDDALILNTTGTGNTASGAVTACASDTVVSFTAVPPSIFAGSPRTLPAGADEAGGTAVKFYELRDNLSR